MNFEIVEAETGEQAIALVRTIRFDAVLLDIGMPGMNGIETCREIRKLMPLLGIVMFTVKNTEEDKIRGAGRRRGRLHHQTVPYAGTGGAASRRRAPRHTRPRPTMPPQSALAKSNSTRRGGW